MKLLKQLLFTAAIVVGIAMTASAQNDGQKPPPKPREDPPKIRVPEDKKPPSTPTPKKPGFALVVIRNEELVVEA